MTNTEHPPWRRLSKTFAQHRLHCTAHRKKNMTAYRASSTVTQSNSYAAKPAAKLSAGSVRNGACLLVCFGCLAACLSASGLTNN
ncbi:hypothetical protein BDW74DRAFT_161391 [Aspergillus multicolor]|uniref:uncharacterized protein n=1 Tax=Aspergillus multicolor TaxID=41759 RepID=UPI003CCDDEF2